MHLAVIWGLGTMGPRELIILHTIVLLLFGAKKIPELAKGLGTGVREFKSGIPGEADRDVGRDHQEDKELSQGEALRNEEVRVEGENTHVMQTGQKH